MYYELILNDSRKELLKLAQKGANTLHKEIMQEYWHLADVMDPSEGDQLEELAHLSQGCAFFLTLKNLLESFKTKPVIIIDQNEFHSLRTNYLNYHLDIDNLFSKFNKRSYQNKALNFSYRIGAMRNSHELHKENLAMLNPSFEAKSQKQKL